MHGTAIKVILRDRERNLILRVPCAEPFFESSLYMLEGALAILIIAQEPWFFRNNEYLTAAHININEARGCFLACTEGDGGNCQNDAKIPSIARRRNRAVAIDIMPPVVACAEADIVRDALTHARVLDVAQFDDRDGVIVGGTMIGRSNQLIFPSTTTTRPFVACTMQAAPGAQVSGDRPLRRSYQTEGAYSRHRLTAAKW